MFRSFKAKGKVASSLQQLFVAFLILMLALISGAFVLKSSLSDRISKLDRQMSMVSAPGGLDSVLLELSSAENDLQQAYLHNDEAALMNYKASVNHSFKLLTSIMRYAGRGKNWTSGLTGTFQEKVAWSGQLFRLRRDFDSLMNRTTSLSLGFTGENPRSLTTRLRRLKADTIVATKKESSKAGLFSRLKDAIRNKADVKVVTIRERTTAKTGRLSDAQQAMLRRAVQELDEQYARIGKSGQQLVAANLKMLSDLRQLVEQVRRLDIAERQKLKNEILKQYRETSDTMDRFSTVGLILLLIFTLLLIFYVKRTMNAEKEYFQENERAIILAGQKSEILAIMSHEVRNKLTGINGAVFMLKRGELSGQQLQKVDAIGYSSALMLETVNTVLDVSKIEYGNAEVLKVESFRPLEALKEVAEAMRFSAEKNGLSLTLVLNGDAERLVYGDALRLKQVVINLVGNAVKFTKVGGITIGGELDQRGLLVTVSDTGPGIAAAELAKLFTRYYQADKETNKSGTGLGLYLCRKLVELQGGRITMESEQGVGSTVTFNIPYEVKDR